MALETYRAKRDFEKTSEPKGSADKVKAGPKLSFVVQKHQASHLHYDFRLEWKGVLLSWAVPKGPSLDPTVKRLAMAVEDHPIEYGEFEGAIPEGEYGGGTVMLWDHGTWEPLEADVDATLEKGDFKFILYGSKLKGSWVLVRTRGFGSSSKPSWLLIKHKDEYAGTNDIVAEQPKSVKTRRLMSEIAEEAGGNVAKAAEADPLQKPGPAKEAGPVKKTGVKKTAKQEAK